MYKSQDKIIKNNKKTAKKQTTKSVPKSNSNDSFFAFLRNGKMIKVYGILLSAFSIIVFLAIISFFFTHDADEAFINSKDNSILPDNIIGSFGAYLSFYLTKYLFGYFTLGLPVLFFLYGVRITFKTNFYSLFKLSVTILMTIAWFSMTLGFFTYNKSEFVAGAFGNFTSAWLYLKTNLFGSIIITSALFIVVLILCYNFSFKSFLNLTTSFSKREEDGSLDAELKSKVQNVDNSNNIEMEGLYIEKRNSLRDEYDVNKIELEVENRPKSIIEEDDDVIFDSKYDYEPLKEGRSEDKDIPFIINDSTVSKEEDEELEENIEDNIIISEEEIHNTNIEPYDPRADLSLYEFPNIDLLKDYGIKERDRDTLMRELTENKVKIESTLRNFGIQIKSISANIGPTVTLYEMVPDDGVRISKIKNLEDDIALNMSALGIRIIAPIPGKGTIGIEVPNRNPNTVSMREIIASDKFQNNQFDLPVGLGKTISDEAFVVDLAKMPHLLMAGATGQGKSVGLNAIITSLLYKKHPGELKFVMIDPKKVEFSLYTVISNYYLAQLPDVEEPIITDTKKVIRTLNSLCKEMDDRYDLLKAAKTRNIKEYNAKYCERKLSPHNGHRYLPYIVLLIDEFGDLIMTAGREIEVPIARIAQLARAVGIHLIIATQRPSVKIITGSIKANFPARISFRVSSQIDSRTILDCKGAEQLIGKGDMLISTGSDLIRLQCAFINTPEVENIVKHIENQQSYSEPFYLPEVADNEKGEDGDFVNPDEIDQMFMDAATMIVVSQQGSTSLLQRKLSLGYNRAGRIMDQLEEFGIVGPSAGSKAREVRVKTQEELREIFVKIGLL